MNVCVRCDGTGFQEFEEDGRWCRDACYHCGTTGKVDDDMAFHDSLHKVAQVLAYNHVCEMRNNRNSNPDGEDWDFCAAENMMSGRDYFDMHVYDYTAIFADQLDQMKREDQELMVMWAEMPMEVRVEVPQVENAKSITLDVLGTNEDSILF